MRVVDRVHGFTAGDGPASHPAGTSCLAELDVGVVVVADLAHGCTAAGVDVADLAGGHTQLGVGPVLGHQLDGSTGRAGDLGAAQGPQLNGVDDGAGGDVAQRQVVAGLDVGLGTGLDDVTLLDALRGDDVALLAVCEVQKGDAGRAVGIVFDLSHLGGHAVLVPATEVDEAVLALVSAAAVAAGDAAIGVASAGLAQLANQRLLGLGARDFGEVRNRGVATARGRRLVCTDSHNLVLP